MITVGSRVDGSLLAALTSAAHAAADAARVETLRHFRRADLGVEDKAGEGAVFDPVTLADRAAEVAMRDVIGRLRPGDGIEGEELAPTPSSTGLTWVIDPIDGTRAYVAGAPTWGILVAVSDDRGPILGMIDQPWTDERFVGAPGSATLRRGRSVVALRTRAAAPLSDAILSTTFPEVGTPSEGAAFAALAARARLVRYGLDCYAYGLVAAGHIDLVVEAGLKPWDIQAPMAVIDAAGGIVTDWRGGPAHRGGRVIAAGNRALHAEALEILSEVASD